MEGEANDNLTAPTPDWFLSKTTEWDHRRRERWREGRKVVRDRPQLVNIIGLKRSRLPAAQPFP
jgi:hypothetical protein